MAKKVICVEMNEELKEQLKKISENKMISQNAIIRLALQEYIERNK